MQKVFLVTGFNNWGKTTLLTDVFRTKVFYKGVAETFGGYDFLVMPQSNDDLGKTRYEREFRDRLDLYKAALGQPQYVAAAFCPTKEKRNDSITILRSLFSGAKIEMLLLEYKWCNQAKLILSEVDATYTSEKNVTSHHISSRTRTGRLSAAQGVLTANLP
jgi:hypothetical protein